jgi:hypothetical protein
LIAQLKSKLFEQQALSRHSSPGQYPHRSPSNKQGILAAVQRHDAGSPDMGVSALSFPQAVMEISNPLASDSPGSRFRSQSDSPELLNMNVRAGSDPFLDLLFAGWNTDLPDPSVLNH